MLSASPLGNSCTTFDDIKEGEASVVGFGDFCIDDNFPNYIDFSSEPFEGFDGEVLPDLEVDPADIFAEFCTTTYDESQSKEESTAMKVGKDTEDEIISIGKIEEIATRDDDSTVTVAETKSSSTSGEEESKRKPSTTASAKSSHGKRKVKVISVMIKFCTIVVENINKQDNFLSKKTVINVEIN
jgi:hypothetical protein